MKARVRQRVKPYLFILPGCLFTVLFIYGVATGIMQGFGILPALGLDTFTLEYYKEVLSDTGITSSLFYSLYLALVSSVLALVGGVVLSAVLTRLKVGRFGQIAGIQVPVMTAHAVAVLFVIALFSGTGLIPRALCALGLVSSESAFPTVVGAVSGWGIILVYFWKEMPFVAFCTLTIMRHIGDRYAETSACLGASPLRTFFTITLPLCKGAITKAFLVVFAFSFGAYEVPYLLGATLPKALPVLAYFEFQNPSLLNRPYAMAINGVMAGVTLILAIIYFRIMRSEKRREL